MRFDLDKEEIFTKEVKRQKKSGVIYVPKGLIGKKVVIIVKENENEE